jgi:hypothetical protein
MMPNQDRYDSTDGNPVQTYKQDAFSTTLMFFFCALLGALFLYMAWDANFGPPPDPKKFSKASSKMLASAPKEVRIFFFGALGSALTVLGGHLMRKLFVNPSVISITPAGIEYEKSSRRKKSIPWTEMKAITFHRGAAHFSGQADSINVSLFIHGVGRQEILRDVKQYRPDLIEKYL